MKLEYIPQIKLQKLIKKIFNKYLPKSRYRLFFFGSRVQGKSFPRSDIDLGIEGQKKIPAQVKLEIEEELQNLPILYKIDLVDFSNVSEDFKKKALRNIEEIN